MKKKFNKKMVLPIVLAIVVVITSIVVAVTYGGSKDKKITDVNVSEQTASTKTGTVERTTLQDTTVEVQGSTTEVQGTTGNDEEPVTEIADEREEPETPKQEPVTQKKQEPVTQKKQEPVTQKKQEPVTKDENATKVLTEPTTKKSEPTTKAPEPKNDPAWTGLTREQVNQLQAYGNSIYAEHGYTIDSSLTPDNSSWELHIGFKSDKVEMDLDEIEFLKDIGDTSYYEGAELCVKNMVIGDAGENAMGSNNQRSRRYVGVEYTGSGYVNFYAMSQYAPNDKV